MSLKDYWLQKRVDREEIIVGRFHELFYSKGYSNPPGTWNNTFWLGTETLKNPLDLWIYQEIIFDTQPDIIIECGTYFGGSALYLASLCNMMNHGQVITIDIEPRANLPQHPRITYIVGSSTSSATYAQLQELIAPHKNIMVILDSDHGKAHVLQELRLYSPLVTMGCYLIVEDTDINGHPVFPTHGPGPMEAVEQFLHECDDFMVDESKHKFLLTSNPKGYLRKVR